MSMLAFGGVDDALMSFGYLILERGSSNRGMCLVRSKLSCGTQGWVGWSYSIQLSYFVGLFGMMEHTSILIPSAHVVRVCFSKTM